MIKFNLPAKKHDMIRISAKRFVSLDLLRGIAIICVLFFHMLQVVWDYESVLANGFPWPYYPLVIILAFFGQANVLFVALSGLVNTISMDRQWKSSITQNATATEKQLVAKKILKSQIIRGLFIFTMAYIYDIILDRFVLNLVKEVPNPAIGAINGFYSTNVLHAIAWGTIISAIIYTQLLRRGKEQEWAGKLLLLASVLILILTPFMITLSRTFPYFYTGWQYRSLGWNILYFFLNSIFRGTAPLFPFASCGVIGAVIGFKISSGTLEKAYAKRWFILSIGIFMAGVFLSLLCVAELHKILNISPVTLPYYFIESVYDVGTKLMVLGGSLLLMLILLYMIDIQGRAKWFAKHSVFIRRFGLVSLTVFSLQWLTAGLLIIYHNIMNMVTGASTPFIQGNFAAGWYDFRYAPGLTAWETVFWFSITFAFWHIFIALWEKAEFKGSFEWLTIQLITIGRKDASKSLERARLDMSASLYNVESLVERPQSYWSRKTIIGLWLAFIIMVTLDVVIVAMILEYVL